MRPNHRLVLRFSLVLVVLIASLSFMLMPASAQTTTAALPTQFADQTTPEYVLASYYNAITLKDYARAYGYWHYGLPNTTYQQFANGFADTARVDAVVRLPAFIGAGAGNLYASLPTLLIATKTNNTQQYFVACFTMWKPNVPVGNNPEPDPNWWLDSAKVETIPSLDFSKLDTICEGNVTLKEAGNELRLTPFNLLASYYNAILWADYARAFGFWQSPPSGTTLDRFSNGFSNVADVKVYVRLAFNNQGAAGSLYSAFPTMLYVTQKQGNPQLFAGCFTMRKANVPVGTNPLPDPNWWLYNAKLNTAATLNAAMTTLLKDC